MKWPWIEIAVILAVVCAYNLSVAVPFANGVQDHHKSSKYRLKRVAGIYVCCRGP